MIRLLKHWLIILAIVVAHLALSPLSGRYFNSVNVALVSLVFMAVVYNFSVASGYALVLGLIFETYSVLPFGLILIGYGLTLYAVYKVFKYMLTNKSFYTLIGLVAMATLVFEGWLLFYVASSRFWATRDLVELKSFISQGWQAGSWQILGNVVLMLLYFAVFHFTSKRFKAVFIDTVKN